MKTSTLSGRALDYAVALAESLEYKVGNSGALYVFSVSGNPMEYSPTMGRHGDAIIDREYISTMVDHSGVWIAYLGYNLVDERRFMTSGTTRREAAMRTFVAFKLGNDIDIPEELL